MNYFRTGVAIATMLMGLDFAFAGCPVAGKIPDPSEVEVLDNYLKQYRIDRNQYLYYEANNSDGCSQIEDPLPDNASVLVLEFKNGEVSANVTTASIEQIVEHQANRVYLMIAQ
jgi:hypothetical protein